MWADRDQWRLRRQNRSGHPPVSNQERSHRRWCGGARDAAQSHGSRLRADRGAGSRRERLKFSAQAGFPSARLEPPASVDFRCLSIRRGPEPRQQGAHPYSRHLEKGKHRRGANCSTQEDRDRRRRTERDAVSPARCRPAPRSIPPRSGWIRRAATSSIRASTRWSSGSAATTTRSPSSRGLIRAESSVTITEAVRFHRLLGQT